MYHPWTSEPAPIHETDAGRPQNDHEVPVRNLVEKAQCCHRDEYRAGGEFLFVRQEDLIGTDVLRAQLFRRLLK